MFWEPALVLADNQRKPSTGAGSQDVVCFFIAPTTHANLSGVWPFSFAKLCTLSALVFLAALRFLKLAVYSLHFLRLP
jgi:hypothetical protein